MTRTASCMRRCFHCQERGATIGCRVERCTQSFHLHCAQGAGCTFYPAKYAVACPMHAPAFRHEADQDRCCFPAATHACRSADLHLRSSEVPACTVTYPRSSRAEADAVQ